MPHLSGTSLAGGTVNHERVDNDFYATPPESTIALLENYELFGWSFYDPCCGQGHISRVLMNYFPDADHYASDIADRGFGVAGIDFLNTPIWELPIPDEGVDWVITNPPYKYAKEFVERSLDITNIGVAMFLKIQFLEGKSRKEFFQNTPLHYVYVFSERQNPLRDGLPYNPKTGKKWASTMCFAWFIWEHGYEGEPIIRWL